MLLLPWRCKGAAGNVTLTPPPLTRARPWPAGPLPLVWVRQGLPPTVALLLRPTVPEEVAAMAIGVRVPLLGLVLLPPEQCSGFDDRSEAEGPPKCWWPLWWGAPCEESGGSIDDAVALAACCCCCWTCDGG